MLACLLKDYYNIVLIDPAVKPFRSAAVMLVFKLQNLNPRKDKPATMSINEINTER